MNTTGLISMKIGVFNENVTVEKGHAYTFLNTPFKACVDFIIAEAYLDPKVCRKIYQPRNNYNMQLDDDCESQVLSVIKRFVGTVIIESDFDSSIAIGMYKGNTYDVGKKAKYHNDDNAKKQMLQDILNFINKTTLYAHLINTETVVMSIPRNRNKTGTYDVSEWLAENVSIQTGLQNITKYVRFYKNGDLKPDIENGHIIKKNLAEKEKILNESELWFSYKLMLYKNKKVVIIDNMHDSGATVRHVVHFLREILEPSEVHCLFYSKI